MLVHSSEWGPMIQNLELKPLCSLVLERTINDPDKYQTGLTKIFFRAGMLAALESLRSDRLNALVTVVQKNMRRRMAVSRYRELRQATIKIQTWWRGILARRFVEGVRREAAAIRLQTAIRCFLERRKFLGIRRTIVGIQSCEQYNLSPSAYSNTMIRCSWCTCAKPVRQFAQESCGHDIAKPVTRSVSGVHIL